MNVFGLIGRKLDHSFSKSYFENKFKSQKLHTHQYKNFELNSINDLQLILDSTSGLKGLNVTIPYKEEILQKLDRISLDAQKIGAVNCITIMREGKSSVLLGHNTDWYGFMRSLEKIRIKKKDYNALILGTGGASKAIVYALQQLGIPYKLVGRSGNGLKYSDLDEVLIKKSNLIINTTPLGTYPNIKTYPSIPYHFIDKNHLAYDLVYNPTETSFLKKCRAQEAAIKNGREMLEIQAEKSWEIWNS